jgi:hypothetical protein
MTTVTSMSENHDIVLSKSCGSCRETKTIDEYNRGGRGKYGRQVLCKKCQAEARRIYMERNLKLYLSPEVAEKVCGRCGETKKSSEFTRSKVSPDGLMRRCRDCRMLCASARRAADPRPTMITSARSRSREIGVDFDLSCNDIVIPVICPVLGIKLASAIGTGAKSGTPSSPSLDRSNPHLGYVKGNVRVISHRANMLKNNATLEELEMILAYMERHITSDPEKAERPSP